MGRSLSAAQAAARLGVSRATLYAYVSRGLVRSEEQAGTRERRYLREDVEALLRRREARRDPPSLAREALHFGAPVLDSSLARIDGARLFYRGHDAVALARSHSIEAVASLLWSGDLAAPFPDELPAALPDRLAELPRAARALPPLEGFQVLLAACGACDPAAFDLSPDGVRKTGARIVRLLAAAAAGATPSRRPIAETLAQGFGLRARGARRLLDAALVLWADHELNVSTFTARCVASALATPWSAVTAGLAALRGVRHGGATEQVEALFEEAEEPGRAARVVEARLRRGELLPGFGHPLYPDRDPRAEALLELARGAKLKARGLALAERLAAEGFALCGKRPNVDFALVALRRALDLPERATLSLVAVGRSVGWIAHGLEQYADGRLIRPRARYVGEAG
jgi:citrate synthase